jgi:hypothetical protein
LTTSIAGYTGAKTGSGWWGQRQIAAIAVVIRRQVAANLCGLLRHIAANSLPSFAIFCRSDLRVCFDLYNCKGMVSIRKAGFHDVHFIAFCHSA